MTATESTQAGSSHRTRASRADDIILASKIVPPSVPDWMVVRPRIDKLINDGVQGPLTLVSGPPGGGKTMAIASWAASRAGQFPIAWVMLDEYDNRPRAFWSYVVEALRRAGVEIPRTVWASGRDRAVDYGFILRLTATITAAGSPVVLILDDLHLVTEHRSLVGLTQLLRNARPHLHLVVAARLDPLLPLHRYRLAGELAEIRAAELAFSLDEASALIEQHGVDLPAESVQSLTIRTGGWVAALRLAAISMRSHPDPEQFVKEVAAEDGAVAGYLVEEVLSTLTADVRYMLLRTSILDRVSADLASELADDNSIIIDLSALAHSNAFIQPLGNGWYRYHPLLAEVLRLKLRREIPDLVPDLHRRAARWLRRNGTLAEAARQAKAGGDWQLASRIAIDEFAVGQLVEPHGSEPLAQVLRGMPDSTGWTEPQPLLVAAALGLVNASDETVGASLSIADGMLEQIPPDEEIPSRLARAAIRLVLAHRNGDLHAAKAAVADSATLLDGISTGQRALHAGMSAQVLAWRGSVELWSGHFDQAAATLGAAAEAVPDAYQRTDCLGHLALLEVLRGRLSRATELAQQAIGPDEESQAKAEHSSSRAALVALAYVHLERNELPEARRWLSHADEALQLCPDKLISAVACLVAARGCLAENRAGPVPDLVARALQGWSPVPWLKRSLALVETQALAAEGKTAPAVDAARRADPRSSVEATAALAHAWLAAGDVQAAKTAVADGPPPGSGPDHIRLQAWLVDARISDVTGDRDRSHRALEHALQLADAEQRRLPFVMERGWIRGVLQRNPNLAHAYRHLLGPASLFREGSGPSHKATPGRPPISLARPAAPAQAVPAVIVVDELSDREREVLEYVSQMLGTAEIAEEMFVSINTVKSHLKSIFRKLGAASRNEAVRRARHLQLI
ncbi:MAG: LuxR C-terminal-related transcriptional regulator [Actinomycetota bacterium]|nr:LuxR C-terminal-related transcriptional regulator [Actinomycetota bacterium]